MKVGKKIGLILPFTVILTLLVGCKSSDYQNATELMKSGQYEEAQIGYAALGDYKDASERATMLQIKVIIEKYREFYENMDALTIVNYDMDKQVAEAQARYNRMAATIDSTTRAATDKGIEKYKTDTYLPAVRKSIDAIFEYVLSKYCDCLSSVGRFDKSCLNGIDEARSNSILSNLDVVEDKDKVIYSAIQRCPYNLAIYTEIAKRGLQYSETHKDILNYLNLSSPLCDLLALRFPINPYLGLLQAHERVQPLISQIRYLESCDVVQATTKALSTYIKRDLTDYILFANEIKQHGSVKGLFAQREKITDRFQARAVLFKYHLPKETMDLYRSIDVDIFSTLSKILGRKISSFDEADTIILSAWN